MSFNPSEASSVPSKLQGRRQGATTTYEVQGGQVPRGVVKVPGAKNAATKMAIIASLGSGSSQVRNVPDNGDVDVTLAMVRSMGADVTLDGSRLAVGPVPPAKMVAVAVPESVGRTSLLVAAAALHRARHVKVPLPGGCEIGRRPIGFHVDVLEAMGAEVELTRDTLEVRRHRRLRGRELRLPYPSVGATETALVLAVLAEGRTVLKGVAAEPEIGALIAMLRTMGARIECPRRTVVVIDGVQRLQETTVTVPGDRIHAGSWACLAAATGGDITVEGIDPRALAGFLSVFASAGGRWQLLRADTLRFARARPLQAVDVSTGVFPGFPTDLQQPLGIMLTQARGTSRIHETVYEDRLAYLGQLRGAGVRAEIDVQCPPGEPCRFADCVNGHVAVLEGPVRLRGFESRLPDLRGGFAQLMAALVARGPSRLEDAHHLERGYGRLDRCLGELGVSVRRRRAGGVSLVSEPVTTAAVRGAERGVLGEHTTRRSA